MENYDPTYSRMPFGLLLNQGFGLKDAPRLWNLALPKGS